jgi:signal transduction histidine kinase
VDQVQPHAERKGVDIAAVLPGPSCVVLGDEGTLVEALANVLDNAVKYSRADSRVELTTETGDERVEIAIRDRGVGIAQEDLPFIFDAFYRGPPGAAAERGTGLGLALTRRIVEAHGGSIDVESEPGKGSVFVITLPTGPAQPDPTPSETAVAVQPSGDTLR